MTVVRIWRATIDSSRADEYEQFAGMQSEPMFDAQPGFRGVLFARRDGDVLVISLWRDAAAVAALDDSPSYQRTVRRINEAGFMVGDSSLEVFTLHGGTILTDRTD